MKVLVSWSGGKDSQATLIWAAKRFGASNIEAVFCDTGWEHQYTYKHVHEITESMGVKLVILKNKKYNGMLDLAKKKGRFPSTKARFCTEELKTKPMIDYVLSLQQHLIIIQGIRADESASRSLMNEQCRYFRYYFEPYTWNTLKLNALLKKKEPTKKEKTTIKKLKERLALGKEDYKYHTYRKKDVFNFCEKYADDVMRPCFNWTGIEVMNYIIQNNQSPNPLYFQGAKRVGCYPCIMCSKGEIKSIMDNSPERTQVIKDAEKEFDSSFFPPDYIPERYRSKQADNGKKYGTMEDVERYVNDKHATGDLFAEIEKEEMKDRRCMSFYGICE